MSDKEKCSCGNDAVAYSQTIPVCKQCFGLIQQSQNCRHKVWGNRGCPKRHKYTQTDEDE